VPARPQEKCFPFWINIALQSYDNQAYTSCRPRNDGTVTAYGSRPSLATMVHRQRQWHNQALGAREGFPVRSNPFSPGDPWFRRRPHGSVFRFESSPTVQDASPSAAVYIVRRDVAKPLVVPLGVVLGDELPDLGLNARGSPYPHRGA
jgi:hypothetical protein